MKYEMRNKILIELGIGKEEEASCVTGHTKTHVKHYNIFKGRKMTLKSII
jgi:hypothetical protein